MTLSWRILKSAVEQETLFPSKSSFETYVEGLVNKGEPHEVLSSKENEDGTVTVVMRKRYNHNNEFFWEMTESHGKWVRHPLATGVVRCSECAYPRDCRAGNCCPECGAKMDLK